MIDVISIKSSAIQRAIYTLEPLQLKGSEIPNKNTRAPLLFWFLATLYATS